MRILLLIVLPLTLTGATEVTSIRPSWDDAALVYTDFRQSFISAPEFEFLKTKSKICIDTRGYHKFTMMTDRDGHRIPSLESLPRVFVIDAGVTLDEAVMEVSRALGLDKYYKIDEEHIGPFSSGSFIIVRENLIYRGLLYEGSKQERTQRMAPGDILFLADGMP